MVDYIVGNTDPPVARDPGAGVWNSEPRTLEMILKKAAILDILPSAAIVVGDDAAKHMLHYMRNVGTDYTIDLEDMLDDVPAARANYNLELEEAKRFVETLAPGVHEIASTRITPHLYNTKAESYNWYFAIGGYSAWGKGLATVDPSGSYQLNFEYKFFDRYNWDGGKKVTLFGIEITDEFMARFHREGLAMEFDCWGSVREAVTWAGGAAARAGAGAMRAATAGAAATAVMPGMRTYMVRPGDSLSKIAGVYYGNIHLWPRIYEANREVVGANPNLIQPGQILVIP
jgi:hypothetical protein